METCYLCFEGRAGIAFESWDFASLKLIRGMFRTCPKHTELVESRIKIFEADEPKKYVLKAPTGVLIKSDMISTHSTEKLNSGQESGKKAALQFLPPIPKVPIKNYQDREPGEEG